MSKTAGQLIADAIEFARDPDLFDQETGELNEDYFVRLDAMPKSMARTVLTHGDANPELQRVADSIVDTLMAEYSKTEVHTILALAGVVSLPREVLKESANNAPGLRAALASIAMLHNAASEAADVVATKFQPQATTTFTPDDFEDEIPAEAYNQLREGLIQRGFVEVEPGVWTNDRAAFFAARDEQER